MVLCIQWKLLLGTDVYSLFREYNRGRRNASDHSYISRFYHSCNTTIDNAFISSIHTLAVADIADIRVSGNVAGIAGTAVISDIKDISDNLADIANISDVAGITDITNVTDVSNLNLTRSSHNAPAVADITHLDFNTTKDRPHGDHHWSSSGHTTRTSRSSRPVIVFERAKEKAKRGGCEPRPTTGTRDVNICVFWK